MLKNYFTAAFRNFRRNSFFSAINVLGLAIGISAALVIFLIVHYEFSYDKFEKDNERIYRVVLDMKFNGIGGHSAAVQAPLANAVAHEMTGIEATAPVMSFQGDGTAKVTIDRDNANAVVYKKQDDIAFTNPEYFHLIPFTWIAGSQQAALKNPFSTVLTESRASQYFPGIPLADVLGKKIVYNDDITVYVRGIVKDLHQPTSFTAQEFISYTTIAKTNLQHNFMMDVWDDWMAYSHLYIKLAKGAAVQSEEAQLNILLNKYNKNANKDAANTMAFRLQPLSDLHFNADYNGFGQRIANRKTLYGLLAIASFLLLLGCINFINLTTAQAAHRAKEIGIRKTMGSSKPQLIAQFLGETLFITLVATLLSVALTPLLLTMFKDFIPPGLHFDLLHESSIFIFLLLLVITVSFLSGLYPALVLSGYKPVTVLKNQSFANAGSNRNAWVRKTLTVSQFVIAQFFVIATLMVSKQINYSINSDLGFNKEAIITIDLPRDTVKTHPVQLLQSIKSIPGVAIASTGFMAPADNGAAFTNLMFDNGKELIKPEVSVQLRFGNPDYLRVYQIPLVAGRNVLPSDTMREVLINETFAHALGFKNPAEAVGKNVTMRRGAVLPVVGIIKDFHDVSMRGSINALIFASGNGRTLHIKLHPNTTGVSSWKNTVAQIEGKYKAMYPAEEFSYKFMDETIAKLYESEQQTASLLNWATGLTILISCLGLFGLVIYTTNTRTKEIGIRKILGASVTNIISILSKDFVMMVLLAFVIAAPIAWWATDKWLQDYVYRTDMSWWIFVISGLLMLLAAITTLSIQTIKTAMSNPVKSLRTE
ncbi:MAG: ABC transporter permease [Chitinophagaceae bacterium]